MIAGYLLLGVPLFAYLIINEVTPFFETGVVFIISSIIILLILMGVGEEGI